MKGARVTWVAVFLALLVPCSFAGAQTWEVLEPLPDLPSHFDWRDVHGESYVPYPRHQGNSSACGDFAVVAAMETSVLISQGTPVTENAIDLSEQHLISCVPRYHCDGDLRVQWWPDDWSYLKAPGIPDESCFPFDPDAMQDGGCTALPCEPCQDWQDRAVQVDEFTFFVPPHPDQLEGSLKTAIFLFGQIVVDIQYHMDFAFYSGGVYEWDGVSPYVGGHITNLVGWNDAEGYWILRNQAGLCWGEGGYGRVRYGELGMGYMQGFVTTQPSSLVIENQAPFVGPMAAWQKNVVPQQDPQIRINRFERLEVFHPFHDDQPLGTPAEVRVFVDGALASVLSHCSLVASTPDSPIIIPIGTGFSIGTHEYALQVVDIYGKESELVTQPFEVVALLCGAVPQADRGSGSDALLPLLITLAFILLAIKKTRLDSHASRDRYQG